MRYGMAILLACGMCLTSCVETDNARYLPGGDQVFLVPAGSHLLAVDGNAITTDGPAGRVSLDSMYAPYDGVLMGHGYFLLLVREASENQADR